MRVLDSLGRIKNIVNTGGVSGTEPANTFYAGPTSGANAIPTFRAINTVDIPAQISTSKVYINDSANGLMTIGLTINQGASDDEILALKSSDVSHSFTGYTEADTFSSFSKADTGAGGVMLRGFSTAYKGIQIVGLGTTEDTTKGGSCTGYVIIDTGKADSDNSTVPGTNANIFVVRSYNNSYAKFIVTGGGDIWAQRCLYINDSSNANMTVGITINQSTYDNQILAFKSDDVAHGGTSYAETDTYGAFQKSAAVHGGLAFWGFSSHANALTGIAYYTLDDTTKSSSATAPIAFAAYKKSGTGASWQGADANTFVIATYTSTVFIVDEDGDYLYDGSGSAYDSIDDVALCNTVDNTLDKAWDDWTEDNKQLLSKLGIIHYNEDGHHFVSGKKLARLHNGAIRQLASKVARYEQVLLTMGADPKLLGD
jgi:hypothetical protein